MVISSRTLSRASMKTLLEDDIVMEAEGGRNKMVKNVNSKIKVYI